MNTLIFQNTEYKVRELDLPEYGNILISTTGLNRQLMSESGNYTSEIARVIDEQIFYFVDENQIDCINEDLINIIALDLR